MTVCFGQACEGYGQLCKACESYSRICCAGEGYGGRYAVHGTMSSCALSQVVSGMPTINIVQTPHECVGALCYGHTHRMAFRSS